MVLSVVVYLNGECVMKLAGSMNPLLVGCFVGCTTGTAGRCVTSTRGSGVVVVCCTKKIVAWAGDGLPEIYFRTHLL